MVAPVTSRILIATTLSCLTTILLLASGAAAQCNYDAPAKARQLKTSMVRAMASCPEISFPPPNIPFPPPNTQTISGTPACTPPTPYSDYSFADNGRCDLKMKTKREAPCSNGTGVPCTDIQIKMKCSGLLDGDGLPIDGATASNWAVIFLSRVTLDDNGASSGFGGGNGDMTIIDFPAQYMLPIGKAGKLKGTVGTNHDTCLSFGPCPPKPPDCMSWELLGLKLADPVGRIFATVGTSTR